MKIFMALLLAVPLAGADSYSWRNVKIGGGGFVTGTFFHPSEPGLVYARTDVGGAFRLDTATNTWIPLNDDIGGRNNEFQHLGILSIGLDPNDANRVYLATGQYSGVESWWLNSRIYRSTDRGQTWSYATTSFKMGGNEEGRGTGERLAVDPVNGANILVGSSTAGIWRSTDYGTTWAQLTNFPAALTELNFILYAPANHANPGPNRRVYAAARTLTGQSLWRSDDNGTTWAEVPNHPGRTAGVEMMPLQGSFGADGVFYTTWGNETGPANTSSRYGVWKLSADAATWTSILPPTGAGCFGGISADPRVAGHVVVTTLHRWGSDEVYRSTDGGATWTSALRSGTRSVGNSPWSSGVGVHWMTDVDIDPFNSERVIFNNGFGLIQTTNLTASGTARLWTFFSDGLEELVPLDLLSPTAGPPLVSVVGDYTGFRHDNLDRSPQRGTHQPTIGTTYSISGADLAPGKMIRQGHALTYYSQDAGATWAAFPSVPPPSINNHLRAILSADGLRILWCPPNSPAYYSTDNGTTWAVSANSSSLINAGGTPTYDVLAGAAGSPGFTNATGGGARFNSPSAIALDSLGNRYVADTANHVIRKIYVYSQLSTVAGTAGQQGSTDATGGSARFKSPAGIAVDSTGNVFVADTGNHIIRKITSTGVVTTLAGTAGLTGSTDATGADARFSSPSGLAVDADGNLFVCDVGNHTIRKITNGGVVTTFAGSAGVPGTTNGNGASARFASPQGISLDADGSLFVADTGNHAIRKVTSAGEVTTFAGLPGTSGSTDAAGTSARFSSPKGITIDTSGTFHIADSGNHVIRKITSAAVVTTVAGLAGNPGSTVGNGSAARFNNPCGIVSTPDGINVYVADTSNHTIRSGYTRNTLTATADRADGNLLYLWDNTAKRLMKSTDGGASFSVVASGMNSAFAEFRTVPGNAGHIWVRAGSSGLYRSTDSGTTFTKLASVAEVYEFNFGKAKPGATHPAVYIWGKVGSVVGYFRSDDTGATWLRMNDDLHNFGGLTSISGDPRTYGRVYLGAGGRGIIVGEIANATPPASQASQIMFDDALSGGWTNASPAGTILTGTNPVRRGSAAISVPSGSGKGFAATCAARSLEGFAAVAFWVKGSPPPLQVGVSRGGFALEAQPVTVDSSSDWQRIVVPFSDLGIANITDLTGLRIESRVVNGVTPGAFSIDDIQLVGTDDFNNGPATATVTLSNLSQTYDGFPKSVTATTNPAGLPVFITYDGSPTPPSTFGNFSVSATIDDPASSGSATGTLVITAPHSRSRGVTGWSFTSSNASSISAADSASPLWNPTNLPRGLAGATHAFFEPIQLAAPGDAITLSGSVTIQTTPDALTVSGQSLWMRFGLFRNQTPYAPPTAPVITDWLGYCGMANSAPALYERTGAGHFASSSSGATSRTPQIFASGAISSSGNITIQFQERITRTASGVDVNFLATNAATLATIMSFTYSDATPGNNGVLTGAQGTPTIPAHSPTFSAAGFLFSNEYIGASTASAQFSNVEVNFSAATAAPAQTITFAAIPDHLINDAPFALTATADSGLPVSYSVVSGPATVSGNLLTITGTGVVTVRASQDGGWIYQATQAERSFTVTKVPASATLSDLNQTYDGTAKSVSVTTNPAGLPVTVTYNGSATPPTMPGSYPVTATIDDSTYDGSATGTLVIASAHSRTVDLKNWICTSSNMTAADTSGPLWNPGNVATGLSGSTHAFFQPVTLAAVGDALTLSGSVAVQVNGNSPTVANKGIWFRFGLFRNQTPVTLPTSPVTDWLGYCGMANSGPALYERSGGGHYASSFTGATARTPQTSATGVNSSSGNITIQFQERITRTAGGVDVTFLATDAATSATIMSFTYSDTTPNNNGLLGAAQTTPTSLVYSPTFSAAGFLFSGEYIGTSTASAQFSNMQINFNSSTAAPAQTITFAPVPNHVYGDAPFALSATANSGLPVYYSVVSGPATVSGNLLTITGTGPVTVRASQDGGLTHQAAQAEQSFTVNKATAGVLLSDLSQNYDGSPKAVSVTTTPPGLVTSITYGGSPAAPAAAGTYAVVATISDALYQGSATGSLVIGPTLAAAPPSTILLDGNSITLGVPSLPGYLYQLQTSTTLAAGSWTNIGAPVPGTGAMLSLPDPAGLSDPRRLYRLVITPSVP